jgi:ATP-binding cassette subfamily B protein
LGTILLIVAALYGGVFIATFLQQRLMVLVSQKTTFALRNELKAKMNKAPVSYFDKNTNGALMSVAVNDIENIVTNLQQSLTELISSVILIVGIAWIMISINLTLALVTCVMIPTGLLVMKLFTPTAKKHTRAYFNSMGKLNGQIEETYQGFSVMGSFNGEDAANQQFGQITADMYETGWKSRLITSVMTQCIGFVYNIIYVVIAIIGALHVMSGTIIIGDIQAFFQYSTQFSIPFTKFAQLWGNVLSTIASAERVFNMIDTEEMMDYKKEFPNRPGEEAKVAFDHVEFGYTDEPLMKDFSMAVSDGQMIAIVVHTGVGKTMLINLLERFYEIQDGGIRIDGTDIRNTSRQMLRQRIGMVLQDTWLFSGTFYDNIKYGNENATDEQIYAAAKAAYADDFIARLPDGYNTILNEDADNISQGQRHLITIARAFVSNPGILILDEAISNVDSRTELIIQSAMKRLLKGRTSFVVAHRLSTIYDADRISVMDSGDIVETGSHKELISMNGVYADIYNSQFAQVSAYKERNLWVYFQNKKAVALP